jgi:hypothetical protein
MLEFADLRVEGWRLAASCVRLRERERERERAVTMMTVIYRQWTAKGTNHPIKVIFREL